MAKGVSAAKNSTKAATKAAEDSKGNAPKHYSQPKTNPKNPFSKFDYSNMTREEFEEYCEMVEGKVVKKVRNQLHIRQGVGSILEPNKRYQFDLYQAYPKTEPEDPSKEESIPYVFGIEMKSTKPVRTKVIELASRINMMNHYIAGSNSTVPGQFYFVNQEQDITDGEEADDDSAE